jgi:hypothetical protein
LTDPTVGPQDRVMADPVRPLPCLRSLRMHEPEKRGNGGKR